MGRQMDWPGLPFGHLSSLISMWKDVRYLSSQAFMLKISSKLQTRHIPTLLPHPWQLSIVPIFLCSDRTVSLHKNDSYNCTGCQPDMLISSDAVSNFTALTSLPEMLLTMWSLLNHVPCTDLYTSSWSLGLALSRWTQFILIWLKTSTGST